MAAWADSAAVAELSARVGTLADSTRGLADRLSKLIAATPDTVRDTTWVGLIDRAVEQAPNWHGITSPMAIGWLVPLIGIAVAARYTVKGWKKAADVAERGWTAAAKSSREAQEHGQAIEDHAQREAFLDMLAESLRYFLWQLPFLLRQVEKDGVIGAGQFLHLDAAREGYDRNREKLVLIGDEKMRRRIGRWFYGARIWRSTLERNYLEQPRSPGLTIIGVVKWGLTATLNHAIKEGKAIYEDLGFPKKYPGEEAYDALKRAEEEAAGDKPEAAGGTAATPANG